MATRWALICEKKTQLFKRDMISNKFLWLNWIYVINNRYFRNFCSWYFSMEVFVYCFQNDIWCKLQIQQHVLCFAHRYQHICAALTLFRTQKCSIRISHRLLLPHITNSNFVHTSTATWYYLSGLINRKHSHVLLLWCKMRWSENNTTKKQIKQNTTQCNAMHCTRRRFLNRERT